LAKAATWKELRREYPSNELRKVYPRTDYLGKDHYVFDIKGKSYKLIVTINFKAQMVFI